MFLHSNLDFRQKSFPSNLGMELTEDQRRRMEEKKAEALERKRRNNPAGNPVLGGLTDQ